MQALLAQAVMVVQEPLTIITAALAAEAALAQLVAREELAGMVVQEAQAVQGEYHFRLILFLVLSSFSTIKMPS